MNTFNKTYIWLALAGLLANVTARADDQRFDVDFNAGFAAKHDSNVAIVELDSSAGEADVASVYDAGLSVKARIGRDFALKVGYDYSGTRYREFSEFDLDLHHAHTSLTMRKGSTDTTIAFDRFNGVLDGEDYLTQTQVSPSIARLFGTRWYLRGAYTRADKSFATLDDRNATSDAMRADAYLLFDGMNHYLAVGVQTQAEEAINAEHTFDSVMTQLSWGYRVDLPSIEVMLKAQLRFEERDYAEFVLDSGETRVDDRTRARLEATIPFSRHVSVGASVERTSNTSGLAAANLDRTVYAMEFGVAF